MNDRNNTVDWNTGNSNTGAWNTGAWNTGDWNTGKWNTGNRNTGKWNTGDWNTGDWNTGAWNTGSSNTGAWNTGKWNTGDWNTGDWNTCNRETGFFNTEQSKTIRLFNRECDLAIWDSFKEPSFLYFTVTEWITGSRMTFQEKEDFSTYKTTGGYLKQLDYKEAFQASYKNASDEEKAQLLLMPNFDAEVFFDISGIDVRKNVRKNVRKKDNSKEVAELKSIIEVAMKRIEELEK